MRRRKILFEFCLGFVYLLFLVFVVVLKFDGGFEEISMLRSQIIENEKIGIKNVNLIPFHTIGPYLENITEMYAFKNIVGNIMIFFPLGFIISNIFRGKALKSFVICTMIILLIEYIQLIFKIGFFDVDDVFLNSMGCLFSMLLYHVRKPIFLVFSNS